LRFWDGSQWTVHYSDAPSTRPSTAEFWRARLAAWRVAVGVAWVVAIAVASRLALEDRPQFADVAADAWLVLAVFSLPAVVLAIAVVRTPLIFVTTAVVSCASSVINGWSTMRDTHSTAALGVLATPTLGLIIVAIGWGLDVAWRALRRTFRTTA